MVTDADIEKLCKEKLNEFRLFSQYFINYYEDCARTRLIWELDEDEVRTERGATIIHIATPTYRNTDVINLSKSYAADWYDVFKNHQYVFGSMMRKWSLEENTRIIGSLGENSIQILSTIDEFDQGNQAILRLDEEGRYADTILMSFLNPQLKKMDEFVTWYEYGPEIKKEKGSAFFGTLRHMDVYGVPGMEKDLLLIYEKEKIGLNISPLETHLETRWILHIIEDLNVWQIKPNSCIIVTLT